MFGEEYNTRLIKSRRMWWAGYVEHMGEIKKANTILPQNHKEREHLDLGIDGSTLKLVLKCRECEHGLESTWSG
jgi:hypothetical protein